MKKKNLNFVFNSGYKAVVFGPKHCEVVWIVLLEPIRQPLHCIQSLRLHFASAKGLQVLSALGQVDPMRSSKKCTTDV